MLVEADEQRRRIRRAADLIEEGVQKGVRDHVESEGRLAHLADPAAPCRRVLGGVVRMQAEAHFQLVDGFGRQPGDEDLVQATPGPVMPLETPDAFLDGESDAHGVGHRAEAGERRQIAIRLVVGEAERNLVRHLPTLWKNLKSPVAYYVSFHGRRYSRRRNSFGSVTVPPDPLIVLVTRILAPS